MRKPLVTLAGCIAIAVAASGAFADSIGPNCGSGNCLGNVYTLNYTQTGAQMGTNNYTVTLTINSSAFVDGTNSGYLMAVSPNIRGWSNATLTSAPGGIADWSSVMAGGLDSSGCDGHGAPFFCDGAMSQGMFDEVGSSTPLTFVWTLTDGSLPTGMNGAEIKAYFESSAGKNLGITSAMITLQSGSAVPEASSFFLLGSGLIAVFAFMKRRVQV